MASRSSRRRFLETTSLLGVTSLLSKAGISYTEEIIGSSGVNWEAVRAQFPITSWDKIHLNSGSAGVLPSQVSDHLVDLIRYMSTRAPYEVWDEWQDTKQANLDRLAKLIGAKPSELQVVRNTTEALNMIITGLSIAEGSDVIITTNAYPFAVNAWKRKATKENFNIIEVEITLPKSDDEVVKIFQDAITPNTSIVHVTQMTHREGHIMPVRRLVDLAHQQAAQVVVDGAHVVGQINVDLHELGCDYFASSLHKWLNAPLGTGLIYVSEEHLSSLEGHLSSYPGSSDSMDKYEHIGTRCWANEIGITAALDFHEAIGGEAKRQRLDELKRYWVDRVADLASVHMHTTIEQSCAIATFSIDDYKAGQILKVLDEEYDIHAKSVSSTWGSGVRISPNIFTNEGELDQLISAIRKIAIN